MRDQRTKSLWCRATGTGQVSEVETAMDETHPDSEESPESGSRGFRVPRCCTLDGFAEETRLCEGIQLIRLAPLSRLEVQTQNTLYRIILLDPRESTVLIQGGRFFPRLTEAVLCGSSYGGSLLKSHWIGIGMRMEIIGGGHALVTSPVLGVYTVDDGNLPGPF